MLSVVVVLSVRMFDVITLSLNILIEILLSIVTLRIIMLATKCQNAQYHCTDHHYAACHYSESGFLSLVF